MISEEVKDSNNTISIKPKSRLLTAFRAIFSLDDEKEDIESNADVNKQVKGLNAESAESIKNLEESLLSNKKQEREQLEKSLRPEEIKPLKKEKVTSKKVEKHDEEREL